MFSLNLLVTLCLLGLALYKVFNLLVYQLSRPPFPPGPKGLPFLGDISNLISIPGRQEYNTTEKHQWAHYLGLGKKYHSEIVHIQTLGDHTVVLNSAKSANEILENRSGIYSDRPPMHMHKESGWGLGITTMHYSSEWRIHRRTFHQDFQPKVVTTYQPTILQSCSTLLKKLIPKQADKTEVKHQDLDNFVRIHAGSIILRVVYGMTTQEEMNDYLKLVETAAASVHETTNHGSFLVDYFPWLKYVPAWAPGASFKRKAKIWASSVSDLFNLPWEKIKLSVVSGTATPCIATKNIEKFNLLSGPKKSMVLNDLDTNMEEVVRNTTGIAYFAGSETTVSVIMSTLLALSYHPEVQEKAQKELDMVIGNDRLPNFSDQSDLPYIDAILKEVQRMYPVVPLAIPHCVLSDDVYNGYFIPKGSVVVGNVWGILHDPEIYPNPLCFNPDRFMDTNSSAPPNPEMYAFGFGRRACPGKYFALQTAWIVIASVLATCNITRPYDDLKKEIDPEADFTVGAVVHPKPYNCHITPRSPAALELMNTGYSFEEQ